MGIRDAEIAQCDAMLDGGKRPTLYPHVSIPTPPYHLFAVLMTAGTAAGVWGMLIAMATASEVAMMVASAYLLVLVLVMVWYEAAQHLQDRASLAFDRLFRSYDADLPSARLWRQAVAAANDATTAGPAMHNPSLDSLLGSLRAELLVLARVEKAAGPALEAFAQDVTYRDRMNAAEERVQEISAMATTARMEAASKVLIAHEDLPQFSTFIDRVEPDDFR
jgi:hypothetical protein